MNLNGLQLHCYELRVSKAVFLNWIAWHRLFIQIVTNPTRLHSAFSTPMKVAISLFFFPQVPFLSLPPSSPPHHLLLPLGAMENLFPLFYSRDLTGNLCESALR